MMPHNETKPGRRKAIIGWSVFVAVLVIFGLFLTYLVPPQPHLSFDLPKETIFEFLSDDGASLVTASRAGPEDETETRCGPIEVWDAHTGRRRFSFLDKKIEFAQFIFSPDYRFLAINDSEGGLHLLDIHEKNERRQIIGDLNDSHDLIFSPTGKFLLVLCNTYTQKKPALNYLIETETGTVARTIKASITFHAFSDNDGVLVFTTAPIFVADEIMTGICHLPSQKPNQVIKDIKPIALAPDGRHLLAWRDGDCVLLDGADGKLGHVLFHEDGPLGFHTFTAFSPDSKTLAIGFARERKQQVIFWHVATGKRLGQPVPHPLHPVHHDEKATFSPDSRWLLLQNSEHLAVLDTQAIRWQKEHELGETQFLFSDGSWSLISCIVDGGFRLKHDYEVIDLVTGVTRATIQLSFRSSSSFSRNGRFLGVFGEEFSEPSLFARLVENWWPQEQTAKEQAKVFDVVSGKLLGAVAAKSLTQDNGASWSPKVMVSEDGRTLIVANPQEKCWSIQCWTLPLRPPWHWVMGPPLAILFLAVAIRWLKWHR